jgi:hypothetical protein
MSVGRPFSPGSGPTPGSTSRSTRSSDVIRIKGRRGLILIVRAHEDGVMLDAFWSLLKDPANRDVLTWIGGGFVVVIGGVWAVVKYFAKPDGGAGTSVRADRGGVAAGGSISNSPINTNSDKENSKKARKLKS